MRDGRVRLYTINGADWSKRYPLIAEAAARLNGTAVLDAEVVWLGLDGVPDFDALHSRVNGDLLMLNGDDVRRRPYVECKAALRLEQDASDYPFAVEDHVIVRVSKSEISVSWCKT